MYRNLFVDKDNAGIYTATIGGVTYALAWDDQDPNNEGWCLEWHQGEDWAAINGDIENPDWAQVTEIINIIRRQDKANG